MRGQYRCEDRGDRHGAQVQGHQEEAPQCGYWRYGDSVGEEGNPGDEEAAPPRGHRCGAELDDDGRNWKVLEELQDVSEPERRTARFRCVLAVANGGQTMVTFEDNAAVITTPNGEMKGSDIKGPVAREAAERYGRIAAAASVIV